MFRVNLCEDINGRGLKSRIITTTNKADVDKIIGLYQEKVGSPYVRYLLMEEESKVMVDYGSWSSFIEVQCESPLELKTFIK